MLCTAFNSVFIPRPAICCYRSVWPFWCAPECDCCVNASPNRPPIGPRVCLGWPKRCRCEEIIQDLQDHVRAPGGFFLPLTPDKTFHKTPLRDVFSISLLFQGYEPSRCLSLHDSSTKKDLALSYHTHKVSREFLIEVALRCRFCVLQQRTPHLVLLFI